jgi:phospholipid/cholesterol/gamma-HCH transport system substrate-binding protein
MNERVMQFRIGLFVIVSGLVLTMMVVWFGETPSLLRDQVYLKVRYAEAPGVLEGVPVRKSGIRIGEVMAIAFDDRKGQPEGVIVTLALERRYPLRKGAVPKLTRSLIGDVAIDMEPGTSDEELRTSKTPGDAEIIEGAVAPDPSKALAAATKAFEKAGDTLESINKAASGLAKLTDSSQKVDQLLTTWQSTGQDVSGAAKGIRKFIDDNEGNFQPALADLRKVVAKFNETLDPDTQKALKDGINRFASASARMDSGLADLDPAFKDLGAKTNHAPTTDIGQSVRRFNLMMADLGLLTSKLRDPRAPGQLNTEGSLQKLLIQSDLHDNLNRMAMSANQAFVQLRTVLATLRTFAEKVASDPGAISRGAFGPR